jgi:glutamate/tyrosine decarboxylase-like PLP-dependent enzyme
MKSRYDKIVEAAALIDRGVWTRSCNAIHSIGLNHHKYFNWLRDCGGTLAGDKELIQEWDHIRFSSTEIKEHRVMMLLLYAEITG